MPTKTVRFPNVSFPPSVWERALETLRQLAIEDPWVRASIDRGEGSERSLLTPRSLSVTVGETTWTFNSLDEFIAQLRHPHDSAYLYVYAMALGEVTVDASHWETAVSVEAEERPKVERVMACFEGCAEEYRTEPPEIGPPPKPPVFIGHGHSHDWMLLKNMLTDQFGYEVIAYETGARAGHTIRDILATMMDGASFAIIVMTAEDEQADRTMRARQNVVHEAGLFQGRLGFHRAVVVLESGVEEFSNLAGIQYIPFAKGNIREAFGDVLATLRREFPGT